MGRLCSLLFVLIFSALVVTGCGQSKSVAKAPPPPTVEVETVALKTIDVPREVPAQTFSRHKVDVRGRVDGYIEQWLFRPGQRVSAGQPLYVLDKRPFQAQLDEARGRLKEAEADLAFAQRQVSLEEAKGNLASAEANLFKAKRDFDRMKMLVQQGAISQMDYDAAQAQLSTAEAAVKTRRASVQQAMLNTSTEIAAAKAKVEAQKGVVDRAELNVQYCTIAAPVSGIVGESLIPVGGLVTANSQQPLTTIVPLDPIWVRFKVSEAQHLQQRKSGGAPPQLEMYLADGSKYAHVGQIANTLNEVDRQTGTLEMQAAFPNPEQLLLPGQFARIKFTADHRNDAISIPIKAIQQVQNLSNVFVVNASNKVESRVVHLGPRVGDFVVVEDGLNAGERIIVEGLVGLRPGMNVNVIESAPRTASALTPAAR